MKKMIIIFASAFLALTAGAQNMYDAMTFSQNNYYGTARSMALNNAVTAIGGDLGTVGINPAGTAVSYYGQFTLTPGASVSMVGTSGSGWDSMDKKRTRMSLPNCGVSLSLPTGNERGLKNMTFAFLVNQTNNFNMSSVAQGHNDLNSKLAEFATAAYGYDENVLANYSSFNNSDVPWDVLSAYQSGMFGSYEQGEYGGYVGNSERIAPDGSYHYVPGTLIQSSSVNKTGTKSDIVMNVALNYNDNFYVGFNLGIPTVSYRYSEYFSEAPLEYQKFPIAFAEGNTYFTGATYDYQYVADVSGIYAKMGFIWLPTPNLRIGAAIQSPTAFTIKERWQYGATADFDNSRFNGDVVSPEGEYIYGLRTPYRANFGAALTIGSRGFISVDYELADYSVMRFRDATDDEYFANDRGNFYDVNETNKNFCGLAHQLRVGAEVKVTPAFAIRAGYGLSTDPERHWTDSRGADVTADDYLSNFEDFRKGVRSLVSSKYYGTKTQSYSFGVGYSSPGSFFADFAVRATDFPDWNFAPYYDYYGFTSSGELVDMKAPKISNYRSLLDIALTLGWRF